MNRSELSEWGEALVWCLILYVLFCGGAVIGR